MYDELKVTQNSVNLPLGDLEEANQKKNCQFCPKV